MTTDKILDTSKREIEAAIINTSIENNTRLSDEWKSMRQNQTHSWSVLRCVCSNFKKPNDDMIVAVLTFISLFSVVYADSHSKPVCIFQISMHMNRSFCISSCYTLMGHHPSLFTSLDQHFVLFITMILFFLIQIPCIVHFCARFLWAAWSSLRRPKRCESICRS